MKNLFTTRHSCRKLAAVLIAGALLLAGCDAFNNAWYNASKVDDSNGPGEQSMDQHYLNGDINAQQFNEQVKVFNPQAQLPASTSSPEPAPPVATSH
jgi:N-acetylneuraminic acid mutarotase